MSIRVKAILNTIGRVDTVDERRLLLSIEANGEQSSRQPRSTVVMGWTSKGHHRSKKIDNEAVLKTSFSIYAVVGALVSQVKLLDTMRSPQRLEPKPLNLGTT